MTTIGYNDFAALDMLVGTVTSAVRHPGADRLYLVDISLGELGTRRTVTSLVPYYTEAELIGRSVVALVNLAPAMMRGEKSECMLLCAETDDASSSILLTPSAPIAEGTRIV